MVRDFWDTLYMLPRTRVSKVRANKIGFSKIALNEEVLKAISP